MGAQTNPKVQWAVWSGGLLFWAFCPLFEMMGWLVQHVWDWDRLFGTFQKKKKKIITRGEKEKRGGIACLGLF